jgi:RNA polymerase primary sigma factor
MPNERDEIRVDAELVLAAQQHAEQRAQLVEACMPLIANVARIHAVERDELVHAGIVGLLRALDRYDPALGTPFCAYAFWWVRQAMQHLGSELNGSAGLAGPER